MTMNGFQSTLLLVRFVWRKRGCFAALIQPSSALMEWWAFSILRSCMDERLERSYSDSIAASTLLKYNRARLFFFVLAGAACRLLCDLVSCVVSRRVQVLVGTYQ